MKISEIQIGDFVYCHQPDCKGHQIDLISLMDEQVGADGELYGIEDIEPIPITRDILEKNGFRLDGSGQNSWCYLTPGFPEGKRYNIYVGLKKKTIEVFVAHPEEAKPNWRKHNKVYLEVCGCYVHELQHCLRLAGSDKEIQL